MTHPCPKATGTPAPENDELVRAKDRANIFFNPHEIVLSSHWCKTFPLRVSKLSELLEFWRVSLEVLPKARARDERSEEIRKRLHWSGLGGFAGKRLLLISRRQSADQRVLGGQRSQSDKALGDGHAFSIWLSFEFSSISYRNAQ